MLNLTLEQVVKRLKKLPDDIAFAGAVALTRTAKFVQKAVQDEIGEKFTLRNNWTKRGIRITPATKGSLQAEVYSLDYYIPQQDAGAQRRPKSGKFNIPGKHFYGLTGLNPKKKVIPKRLRPNNLVNTKVKGRKAFAVKFKSGATGIAVGLENRKLGVLFIQVKEPVHIRGRKIFHEPADDAYDKHISREFDIAWNQYVLRGA